jgi:O6-methylguanine-DNA--protein-cysteine methyltransferase
MKKIGLLLSMMVLLGFMVSCNESKPDTTVQPTPQPTPASDLAIKINIIQQSETPTPTWVNKRWEVGKDDQGKKVIYLAVEGQRNTKEKAEIDAESKKIARLTELIKQVATREFAVAKQGMLNDDTELDAYFEETIAAVSKNVNISGAMNVSDYWEYIQEIQGGQSKTYYRFVKRYSMDYDTYQKALAGAWTPVAKKIPPELKNKAQDVLKSINDSDQPVSE